MISGKQIWSTLVLWHVLTRDTFLLTCIDVFSKFAWVVPLKNKSGETLVNGFHSILDLGRSPEKLQTDKGTEFLNRNFQSFLKEKNIHFFATNSELKASVVERVNRTLKTRTWKYFTAKNTRVYIDILQDIVHAYNNSYHRSIGQAPSSVSLLNVGQVGRKLYDETEGVFYAEELQKVQKSDDIYKIEKILAEKKENGKVKVLVKWLGYDKKFNSWLPKSELRKL